jgi:hypothetical protein
VRLKQPRIASVFSNVYILQSRTVVVKHTLDSEVQEDHVLQMLVRDE